jgi:hypothetical protein
VQVSQAYKSPAGLIAATIEIPLTRGYVTRIDAADMAVAAGHKWHADVQPRRRTVYASTWIGGKTVSLHTLIAPDWEEVDHADGNGLNNCRHNLRDGAGFKNRANRVLASNNTSGYKGVDWNKQKGKWRAIIMVNKKSIYLGGFDTPEAAADAYDQAAVRYFGEYALTNAMLRQAVDGGTAPTWQHNPPDERTPETHCSAGHKWTEENTIIPPDGRRRCRQCKRLGERARRRRIRGAKPAGLAGRICPPGCTCGRHRSRR